MNKIKKISILTSLILIIFNIYKFFFKSIEEIEKDTLNILFISDNKFIHFLYINRNILAILLLIFIVSILTNTSKKES